MNTPMRDVAEHQAIVTSLLGSPRAVTRELIQARGLALLEDYRSPADLPAFDNSAMDGYAVRAADIQGAGKNHPLTLPVAADIPAGTTTVTPLEPATAQRIMTGAPIPPGADAVVQVEATDGGTTVVSIREERAKGDHVRAAGSDIRAGEIALPAGTELGPAQLALLAAFGEDSITVGAPLRVLILSTGSELVEPGTVLQPGQIYDANGIGLAMAVTAAGAEAVPARFVADDVDALLATIDEHLDTIDLILTSGGVSAGAYEVVKDALTPLGIDFTKVAMQPGMPQGSGTYRGTPVVTVPGNPVSAFVSFEVFVRPALRQAMGFAATTRPITRATLTEPLTSIPGKRQFRRGSLDGRTGRVAVWGPASSHHLRWLATANCLIDIDEATTELAAGDTVDVWNLS